MHLLLYYPSICNDWWALCVYVCNEAVYKAFMWKWKWRRAGSIFLNPQLTFTPACKSTITLYLSCLICCGGFAQFSSHLWSTTTHWHTKYSSKVKTDCKNLNPNPLLSQCNEETNSLTATLEDLPLIINTHTLFQNSLCVSSEIRLPVGGNMIPEGRAALCTIPQSLIHECLSCFSCAPLCSSVWIIRAAVAVSEYLNLATQLWTEVCWVYLPSMAVLNPKMETDRK